MSYAAWIEAVRRSREIDYDLPKRYKESIGVSMF